jgi:hypothetical protein
MFDAFTVCRALLVDCSSRVVERDGQCGGARLVFAFMRTTVQQSTIKGKGVIVRLAWSPDHCAAIW